MADNRQEVVVIDVEIRFVSMVVLLVKWALAAIPAMIILVSIGVAISLVLGALFGGAGWHGRIM
ncbi:MAG TPA: hypothetical protein VLC73_06395 [Burkholderiales bacterium]|nr:hypothetical protein [Burkholderiales bacterium]